ncbi:glycine--tRNA ligase subunit beta [Basilea psittacipulmonis]|uniref:Glycine--tRNA ligase beta subunit n=1 Tax=Basilea psittacipulmonis DSM 24701 TaxID=1072685 RepID=A0A077DIK1_9BURK|nr:glycine--tRNA ligase subunit beta [Basilea psittacipulmonis]AIL33003.1 glycyl-tRNA synthetase subunit beta [Basilea psittacipulmonis DSM 24701]
MKEETLLVELFTEELPPKALKKLGTSFATQIKESLTGLGLLSSSSKVTEYATPRRLAVSLTSVMAQAEDKPFKEKLMPAKVGLNADGTASEALLKKLAAKNLSHLNVKDLIVESDGKQDYLMAAGIATGAKLENVLQEVVEQAIAKLPIPKVMRYQLADGKTSVKFVRPVHGVVALYGLAVLPLTLLGIQSSRTVHGHRFLSQEPISLDHANDYANALERTYVIASFDERQAMILKQLNEQAKRLNLTIGEGPEVQALLDEVTALVEYPAVYVGKFDERFLQVPAECLILTMRLNQKYFPLFKQDGALSHQFLIVSNMPISDPHHIIEGNERVVRPRLADAEFFFTTDRKIKLIDRLDSLKSIVYHNQLGTQFERVQRLEAISLGLAKLFGADESLAKRAALLSKSDLTSNMVGEFPELQGVIGAYYAKYDGESESVVKALAQQYAVRYDVEVEPNDLTSAILFMAERLETLIGIWGIGLAPTGERDPFGLRRAALGLISVIEKLSFLKDRVDLRKMLQIARDTFTQSLLESVVDDVNAFILERYRNQLNQSYDRLDVDAVLTVNPPILEVESRVKAIATFVKLPEAESLIAANKRMTNLLKKVEDTLPTVDPHLFEQEAEKNLFEWVVKLTPIAQDAVNKQDYETALKTLANSKAAVDEFFDKVMVMADDEKVRLNRLSLLQSLHQLMNLVADISRLAK